MRIIHESQMHEANSFITLTYAPEELPKDRSLNKKHFQEFVRELRRHLSPKKIRYFHCGEYGEEFERPHYHAIIFGYDFPDRIIWKDKPGYEVFRSPLLEKLWTRGFSTVQDVTYDAALYVANYTTQKITGEKAQAHYEIVDPETGEIFDRLPEYATMSRRPGLGESYFKKYKDEMYVTDSVIMKGKEVPLPRYYDKLMAEEDEFNLMETKEKRREYHVRNPEEACERRLRTKEKVKKAQMNFKQRRLL